MNKVIIFPEVTWENCEEVFQESMDDFTLAQHLFDFVRDNNQVINDQMVETIRRINFDNPGKAIRDALVVGVELGMRYQQKYGSLVGVDES